LARYALILVKWVRRALRLWRPRFPSAGPARPALNRASSREIATKGWRRLSTSARKRAGKGGPGAGTPNAQPPDRHDQNRVQRAWPGALRCYVSFRPSPERGLRPQAAVIRGDASALTFLVITGTLP